MPSSEIIAVDHLVKRYGPHQAVRDVSFSVQEGEVIGLLGPNGSGKSTIMRILTGYLLPSAGEARVARLNVMQNSLAVRRLVGYVPEDAPLYDGMRVREFLRFMTDIKGLSGTAARATVMTCCARLDLERVADKPIGALSRGFRQRVAIAQALLGDPPVLFLDEPTNALDAYQVIAVREVIRSLAGKRTVLMASHVLSEIERVANRIMILVDGKLLTEDARRDDRIGRRLRVRIAGPPPAVSALLATVAGVTNVETTTPAQESEPVIYRLTIAPRGQVAADVAQAVTGSGFALSELIEETADLESIFLDLTQRANAAERAAA